MARFVAESILHGLVATLAIRAILGIGRIREPQARLRFWLLAMALPVWFSPLVVGLAPVRLGDSFRDQWSLLSGTHFLVFRWRGIEAGTVVVLVLAAAGLLLCLRDLVPFLLDVARNRKQRPSVANIPEDLLRSLGTAASALRTPTPELRVLASPDALLSCRGWRRCRIVTSTGLLDMLAPDERDAAVAHEVAHARHGDPAIGWGLMLVRLLFLFNPFVQLCARAAAHEIESRADAEAAVVSGGPEPVVRSLRKLTAGDPEHAPAGAGRWWRAFSLVAIEARCRSLIDVRPAVPAPRWALPATAVGLGVILFFTVA